MRSVVDVYLGEDEVLVGRARFSLRHGQITTSFSYDETYLARPDAFAVDPAARLAGRSAFVAGLPGAFCDAAPDRWGRRLLRRGSPGALDEVDYLLGVYDRTRQGALRFKDPDGTAFYTENAKIPPLVQLPRLMAASRAVLTEDGAGQEVKLLLDAGSSTLGGARPKATVADGEVLYIAKFPAPSDGHNVMAWEKTALDLAARAGLRVPERRLVRVGADSVLMTRRFDRWQTQRLPYLSAMTLLGAHDGEVRDYTEIAEALAFFVGDPQADLRELFGRVAFSIAVNNTDDHLRNHGFVRQEGAWSLSPAFDINPQAEVTSQRATAVFGETGSGQARGLREAISYFGLGEKEARDIVGRVMKAVATWRPAARLNGASEHELRTFGSIFDQRAADLREAFSL